MKTMYLIREIYLEGFRNLGHALITNFFKTYAWFGLLMYLMVIAVFLYRVATGFHF